MARDNINKQLETIKDPIAMKTILEKIVFVGEDFKMIEVGIKTFKQVIRANTSYTLTLVYDAVFKNKKGDVIIKKILGSASSKKSNRYAFDMIHEIWADILRIGKLPKEYKIYDYLDEYGLFLRDYFPGHNLFSDMLESDFLDLDKSRKIAKLILDFQKIKIPSKAKPMFELKYMDYNINKLKKRHNKDIFQLEERINGLKTKMLFWHNEYEHVIIHGDLNPFNIIIRDSGPSIIDFDDVAQGDYLIDPAIFVAHLRALKSRKFAHEVIKISEDNFMKSYEDLRGKLTKDERERFNTYISYYDYFIQVHKMVWGF